MNSFLPYHPDIETATRDMPLHTLRWLRAKQLQRQLGLASHLYHTESAPEMTDAEYDAKFQELLRLEDD